MKKYSKAVEHLSAVFEELPDVNLSVGGVGELALAHHLDHTLSPGGKGADAEDDEGNLYEYKVSTTNQFNFHHGGREEGYEARIIRHWKKMKGAYVAQRDGMKILEVGYVDGKVMLDFLLEHFRNTKGVQLNKNCSMAQISKIGETWKT